MAVLRDGEIVSTIIGDPAVTHGQRLPGDLGRALAAGGVGVEEIDLLAVAAGPGSFTGLRVGIASLQGLAFARGLKIVPVSTLEALARGALAMPHGPALIAPWVDAQRGEVYAALYDADGAAVLTPASALPPAETLLAWRQTTGVQQVVFIGDGAARYRDVITVTLGDRAQVIEPVPPLAPAIGRIAALEPGRAVLPHAVVPIYVRRPDAELARDRRAGA